MARAPRSRHQELDAAIDKARLPPRDYRVLRELFRRATWGTAVIEDKWQPKGLADLARRTGLGKATVCRSLDNLEALGWITRSAGGGRGKHTTYQVQAGCAEPAAATPDPASDAARARAYRARRKLSQNPVTDAPETVSDLRVELSQNRVTNCLASRDEYAGQAAFSGKESVKGGIGGTGQEKAVAEGGQALTGTCPVCSTPMDPWLRANGFTTHINCTEEGLAIA